MRLRAHAKINLSLKVFDKRPDRFHNIESVMQSVSLCDYITLTKIPSGVEVTCDDPEVPQGKENLAYKAVELSGKPGIKIHIEKHIPMAAGLAGGSADAAAVLFGLKREGVAAEVGSDVPFCLIGGTCLVKGRGEVVEKLAPWPKTYFVLVCPDIQISAKWAYEEFDNLGLRVSEEIKNDLEPVAVSKYQVISEIKGKLLSLGCSETQMSGSGPSVFGVVKHKADAEEILKKIKEDYPRVFLVETVDKGIEIA